MVSERFNYREYWFQAKFKFKELSVSKQNLDQLGPDVREKSSYEHLEGDDSQTEHHQWD